MGSLAITCVYCGKPLLDAEHAKNHVVNQCDASPSKKLADALEELRAAIENPAVYIEGEKRHTGRLRAAIIESTTALRAAGRL